MNLLELPDNVFCSFYDYVQIGMLECQHLLHQRAHNVGGTPLNVFAQGESQYSLYVNTLHM